MMFRKKIIVTGLLKVRPLKKEYTSVHLVHRKEDLEKRMSCCITISQDAQLSYIILFMLL